ncbi:hypothetical protein P7K49_040578 [Saguinus oedipus]|uniref:Uncharacterized protein n=1 Tax=Saguinus oedipus TaxID=9490 RepID=A0ABQ9TAG8_SAGOE|nr:hypothetical protein P7K49_040578 [Saguinus oedipus]
MHTQLFTHDLSIKQWAADGSRALLQHLGHNGRREAKINKSEVTQEEIHGHMETRISPDRQQPRQVPDYGQEVNPQEQHQEQSLDVGIGSQPEEEELGDGVVVSQGHLERLLP